MRKASGKVRITGQLIDAITGAHLWADRFERDLTDIFALQDEVTLAVVSAIEPKMLQTEIEMATRRRPENLTAYDFYLRAMPQYYLTTREGVAEATPAVLIAPWSSTLGSALSRFWQVSVTCSTSFWAIATILSSTARKQFGLFVWH